jgi:hypothetical protein
MAKGKTARRSTTTRSTGKTTRRVTRAKKAKAPEPVNIDLLPVAPTTAIRFVATEKEMSNKEIERRLAERLDTLKKDRTLKPSYKAACTKYMKQVVDLIAKQDALQKEVGVLEEKILGLVAKVQSGAC